MFCHGIIALARRPGSGQDTDGLAEWMHDRVGSSDDPTEERGDPAGSPDPNTPDPRTDTWEPMNNQDRWTAVDRYLTDKLVPPDAALEAALAASDAAGLPAINVAPNQGKLLALLARATGARRILEIGTLGGYSTIWLARALPEDGRLVTLEFEPEHAAVARESIARAGFADRVDVYVGAAVDSLAVLAEEGAGPFDFIFIDADKQSYAEYFAWSLRVARVGTLIVADNVIRQGAVADPASDDERVRGIQRFFDAAAAEPRVSATAVQTVGSKGYDGFALLLVTAAP